MGLAFAFIKNKVHWWTVYVSDGEDTFAYSTHETYALAKDRYLHLMALMEDIGVSGLRPMRDHGPS